MFNATHLLPEVEYEFRVKLTNAMGCQGGDPIRVTTLPANLHAVFKERTLEEGKLSVEMSLLEKLTLERDQVATLTRTVDVLSRRVEETETVARGCEALRTEVSQLQRALEAERRQRATEAALNDSRVEELL